MPATDATLFTNAMAADPRPPADPRHRHVRAAQAPGTRLAVAMAAEQAGAVHTRAGALDGLMARAETTAADIAGALDALEAEALQLKALCAAGARQIRALMARHPLTGVR